MPAAMTIPAGDLRIPWTGEPGVAMGRDSLDCDAGDREPDRVGVDRLEASPHLALGEAVGVPPESVSTEP